MKWPGFFACIAIVAVAVFSSPVLSAYAQSGTSQSNQGSYDYFYGQGTETFVNTITALNTLKTTYRGLSDTNPNKAKNLEAVDKNIQAITSIQNAYTAEFNTARATKTPTKTQIAALNKSIGLFSTAFVGIERVAEQQAILTGGNGLGGTLRNLNNLLTQANQIDSGTIVTGSDDAGSLNNANAITQSGTSVAEVVKNSDDPSKCSWYNFNIATCIDQGVAWIIKNTLLQIAGFLVWLTAQMLNFAIQISILDFSKWAPDSLYPIWIIVRQIISLAVVFAGLYLGFMYIIGREQTFTRYVGWLIIFALFVNFSYPITRALVDVSNIISLNVYTAAVGTDPLTGANENATAGGLIMNKLGLQGLIASATKVKNAQSGFVEGINSTPGALIAVAFVFFAAYVFFIATAIIATRAAVLVFLIVASPLLLIDSVVPKLGDVAMKMRQLFFQQLIVAPVFMIMLALTLKFMDIFSTSGALSAGAASQAALQSSGQGTIATFFSILMMLIMLYITLKVTKNIAGEVGKFATSAIGKVGGFGLGVASGGAGLLARNSIGVAAARARDSGWMDSIQGSRMGRGLYGLSNSLAQSTFDTRNIGMVSGGLQKAGITSIAGVGMQQGSKMTYDQGFKQRDEEVRKKYASIKDAGARDMYLAQKTGGVGANWLEKRGITTDAQITAKGIRENETKSIERYGKIKDEDKKREYFESLPKNLQQQILAGAPKLTGEAMKNVAPTPEMNGTPLSEVIAENERTNGGYDTNELEKPAYMRKAQAEEVGPPKPTQPENETEVDSKGNAARTLSPQEVANMGKKFDMKKDALSELIKQKKQGSGSNSNSSGGETGSETASSTNTPPKTPPQGEAKPAQNQERYAAAA